MPDRPKLSLKTNIPTDGQLVFDSPKIGTSEHGEYRLYCVKVNGSEYSWFASEQAHEIVQHLKLGKDSPITILKDEYEDGKTHFLINGQSHDDLFSQEAPPKTGDASSEILPMIERMMRDVNALGKDLKYIQGYFELQEPVEKTPNDDDIPF